MIHSLHDVILQILRHAIHEESGDLCAGISKTDLENECARFFLWSQSLDLENLGNRLQIFDSLKDQLLELLLTIASLLRLVYVESELSPGALKLFTQLRSIVESTSIPQSSQAISKIPLGKVDSGVYAKDREYYDLVRARLMSDIGFHVSCLMELLPILQTCSKEVTTEKTLPAQNTSTLSDPGDHVFQRARLPLQDPILGNTMMKVLPRATPMFRKRLFEMVLQHHDDQLPWICSFDDCSESTRVFTKHEWADHEIRWHRSEIVWVCHVCRRRHDILGDWEHHLDIVHNIRLQGDEAVVCGHLSRKMVVKLMDRQICNFCRREPLNFDPWWEAFGREESLILGSSWEAFVEHVSSHMDAIAKERSTLFPTRPQPRGRKIIPAIAGSSKKPIAPEQQSKSGGGGIGGGVGGRQVGVVKRFNDEKGFGFITSDIGDNLFVPFRAIQASGSKILKEGQRVSFVTVQGQKGLQADEVRAE